MTVYPQVIEKVINYILCFHQFQNGERDCSEEAFFVSGTWVHQYFEIQLLPVIES